MRSQDTNNRIKILKIDEIETFYSYLTMVKVLISIAFVVFKLEGRSNRPCPGVTGSRNRQGEIGLT